MSTLDQNTLRRLEKSVSKRTALFGVQATIVGGDAALADALSSLHAIRRGSEVVATFKFTANAELVSRQPTLFAAAAQAAADVWAAENGERTVEQFTERLGQAYEQAHLLFRLAKIPEHPGACAAALADAIERLHGITHLGWVALQFVDDATAIHSLKGKRFLAGEPPIAKESFDTLLKAATNDPNAKLISREEESALAAATGAEVLLQPLTFEGKRLGMLAAGNNGGDDPGLSSFETQLFAACAGYLDTFHANVTHIAQQEAMFLGTLRALTASIDAKDPYTRGHSERVALLAEEMAHALGLGDDVAERYRIAGVIHDIGKIGVPEAVLCKAGKLTDEEFAHIRKHPQIGFDILKDIPGLDDVRPGVLQHHERFDGRGYPNGVKGGEIAQLARVLALADTFDAMSSNRSYRAKMPREVVLAELKKCAGAQFDPELAAIFVKLDFSRFDAALRDHADAFPTPSPAPVAIAA